MKITLKKALERSKDDHKNPYKTKNIQGVLTAFITG